VGWHQDAGDWRCDRIISLTILLDDATAADGCLHVAPGVYRDPELQQPGVRMDLGKAKNQEIIHRAVPIECKAGEGYFFHSLTPHIPGPNHSPHQRKSLHFAYVASRDRDLAAAYTALETITIEAPGRWSGNATRKDDVQ
jgi:ectoine hydroxylase-related dioxygenase (phytanoyl-CoA dioxygenase family)